MPQKLIIRFTSPEAARGERVHRIRNFAEDLNRALAQEQAGQVDNMDAAVTSVIVTMNSRRQRGRVLAVSRAMLRRHSLTDEAVVER